MKNSFYDNSQARPKSALGNQQLPHQSSKPPYFTDKKVLITGASSGLGMALAYWYLNNGAQVALVGRDIDTLTKIGEQFPSQSLVIQCDLGIDLQ